MTKFKIISVMLCSIILLTSCSAKDIPTDEVPEEVSGVSEAIRESGEKARDGKANPVIEESIELIKETGLAGSYVSDIRVGMKENFGMPENKFNTSSDLAITSQYCSSSLSIQELGVNLSYNIGFDKDFQIVQADFEIMNSFTVGTPTDFLENSKQFLKFAASMPYDTNDITKAYNFIDENISSVADLENKSIDTIIGDAKFTLGGNKIEDNNAVFFLTVSKIY